MKALDLHREGLAGRIHMTGESVERSQERIEPYRGPLGPFALGAVAWAGGGPVGPYDVLGLLLGVEARLVHDLLVALYSLLLADATVALGLRDLGLDLSLGPGEEVDRLDRQRRRRAPTTDPVARRAGSASPVGPP